MSAKTMAGVLAEHSVEGMSGGTHIACRCNRTWVTHSEYRAHLATELYVAGFGLVADAKAEALEEAADKIMGPSDVVLDGATCRWNAMALRETATNLRNPS